MKTFQTLMNEIRENSLNGYETAILGRNNTAVKYGSLIAEESELPDLPQQCELIVWNNENIDAFLKDNNYTVR